MKYIKMFESFLASDRADAMKKIETAIISKKSALIVIQIPGSGVIYNLEQSFENVGVDFITWRFVRDTKKKPKSGQYVIVDYMEMSPDEKTVDFLVDFLENGGKAIFVTYKSVPVDKKISDMLKTFEI